MIVIDITAMCVSVSVVVSPEDSQTSVLLSQGTFSWEGPDAPKDGGSAGSLLLRGLDLHVAKVRVRGVTVSSSFARPAERSLDRSGAFS